MNPRKKTIYVVASKEVFDSAMNALGENNCEGVDNYEFKHIQPPTIVRTGEDRIYLSGNAEDNFLINLVKDTRHHAEGILTSDKYSFNSEADLSETLAVKFLRLFNDINSYVSKENDCIQRFVQAHARLKKDSMKPFFLRRTRINSEPTLREILVDALHKSSSDAMKVAVDLRWFDKAGNVMDSAPTPVKNVREAIRLEESTAKYSMTNLTN